MFTVGRLISQKLNHLHKTIPFSNSRVCAFSTAMGKKVGTHNGSFHCDEALACFMIRLTNKFSAAQIVRTRDPQVKLHYLCLCYVTVLFNIVGAEICTSVAGFGLAGRGVGCWRSLRCEPRPLRSSPERVWGSVWSWL